MNKIYIILETKKRKHVVTKSFLRKKCFNYYCYKKTFGYLKNSKL